MIAEAGTPSLLAEVDRLADAGRLQEAIDLLAGAVSASRDPDLAAHLVTLRLRRPPSGTTPAGPWPPTVPDLFADVTGIVEVTAADLGPETLAAALVHHGSLLVRGLLDQGWVDRLTDHIDRSVAGFDAVAAGAPLESVAPDYVPLPDPGAELPMGRAFARGGGGVLAADAPLALLDLIDALSSTRAPAAIEGYLGERPALSVKKTTLRKTPPDAVPGWHQDGSFLDASERLRSVNVWLALSPCGVDAPGLDVVTGRIGEVLRVDTGTPATDFSEGMRLLERTAEGRTARPVFAAGDAMLFDHLTLHQTAVSPSMSQWRYAIESWFFAPSVYPADQLYLAF